MFDVLKRHCEQERIYAWRKRYKALGDCTGLVGGGSEEIAAHHWHVFLMESMEYMMDRMEDSWKETERVCQCYRFYKRPPSSMLRYTRSNTVGKGSKGVHHIPTVCW